MKVRIGVGMGAVGPGDADGFARMVDDLDELGFDSIWLPEVLTAPVLDPLTGLAFAAAHNPNLKLGATMLLPGRDPVRLAKELATLDVLSHGRLLTTFVLGRPGGPAPGAAGAIDAGKGKTGRGKTDRGKTDGGKKGALMDEMLPVLRRLWAGETVSHHGASATFDQVTLAPLPVQQPLEFWTGGMAPAALARCGRFADGWLPSACTPAEAAGGKAAIDEEAHAAGRAISPEHFGVSIAYAARPLQPQVVRALIANRRGVDPERVVPVGIDGLRSLLEAFLAVGFSKFVVRPLESPGSWRAELEALACGVLDLQA